MLQLQNSLTKKKEVLKPIHENKISIYVCGITTYDYCHIGHARSNSVFDTVVRYLRFLGYEVNHVRNITDIDDKIIKRANENQEDYRAVTKRFINAMHEDFDKLNIARPDHEPLATEYLKSGIRIALTDEKETPLDFVLWKSAKEGEPAWTSPWGEGRPGWHIECSAMSMKLLGETFDIHGGGNDLKFPHHENEIAQSEACTHKPFANYWMHNGMVTIDKQKMSKSLGNFFTIREVCEKFRPEAIRYFLISSHYRSPVNYSQASLEIANQALDRFYTCLRGLTLTSDTVIDNQYQAKFIQAMNDDFNTPEALAVLFEMTHEINKLRNIDIEQASELASQLKYLANILGILYTSPEAYFSVNLNHNEAEIETINGLIAERNVARANKSWALADEIRDKLLALNVVIEDGADGTTWRWK